MEWDSDPFVLFKLNHFSLKTFSFKLKQIFCYDKNDSVNLFLLMKWLHLESTQLYTYGTALKKTVQMKWKLLIMNDSF